MTPQRRKSKGRHGFFGALPARLNWLNLRTDQGPDKS